MEVTVYIVNAFTANEEGGNPAGVVLNADDLSDVQMLSIAAEVGFSETAFLSQSEIANYRIRFFTTTEEVELCGHATIASWSLLNDLNRVSDGTYTQETKAGLLSVEIMGSLTYMQQAQPEFSEVLSISRVAPMLGIGENSFSNQLKPQIVSTGLRDLIVIVNDEDALNGIKPDFNGIKHMSREYKITGLHVATILQDMPSFAAARNFAPLVGIDEEAATGTSNGALLCYLKHQKVLPHNQEYRIEQGKTMNRMSYIFGKFIENDIWIGGKATIIGERKISL
jgi:PhzF family phenazine biosynthesis protein